MRSEGLSLPKNARWRTFAALATWILTLLIACDGLSQDVIVRSDLGDVSASDVTTYAANRDEGLPGFLPSEPPPDPRELAEELLLRRALLRQATTDHLDIDPALSQAVAERTDKVLLRLIEEDLHSHAPKIDTAKVAEYYRSHLSEYQVGERLVLRHIFLRVAREANHETRSAVREKIGALLVEVRGGADFDALAREYSQSETSRFGGQIKPTARGTLPSQIDEIVWRLSPGEVSEIVDTSVGFHIFKLDKRLPPTALSLGEASPLIRKKLETSSLETTEDALIVKLLKSTNALFRPELLIRSTPPDTVIFSLGQQRITLRDVLDTWEDLSFQDRRRQRLPEVLNNEVRRALFLDHARRTLAQQPEINRELHIAGETALIEAAYQGRLEELLEDLSPEIKAFFEEHSASFRSPKLYQLKLLTLEYPDDAVPYSTFERLTALAEQIQTGSPTFEHAARDLSDDPSAFRNGDIGWVSQRGLMLWAGVSAGQELSRLDVGRVSSPWLIEVFDSSRLRNIRHGYMLVRLEDVRSAGPSTFEDVRGDVTKAFVIAKSDELKREIQKRVFHSINAHLVKATSDKQD